jgi:bifunctional ADP-heptose synthase (sugar kinase/adenylyltransferase)
MSLESALALIESVKDYNVCFVGDTIVDEYHYVTALGKSSKEHLISTLYQDKETFRGGVEAAANHARSFCKSVHLWRSPKVTRKVRFVDKVYTRKLFEVHYEEEGSAPTNLMMDFDATVVTDFGHGFITGEEVPMLQTARFLAVNAQTNSANIGYNLITKYSRADYIVVDEPEARLAAQDKDSHIQEVILKLALGRCNKFVVTHGVYGAVGYDGERFHTCAAFTDRVVDTLGAGDCFFAVTAPMAKTGSIQDLLLIGNAAGALKCQIVGHRKSITKEALIEFIRASQKG